MKKLIIICMILANFAAFDSLNAQSIIYVNHSATGQNTGQNWANAYKSLNDAISHAQYGDTLWVAQGTYYPPSATVRDSAILIKNGVKLFGGFSGTETAFAQRNINLYRTILSGDIGVPGDSTDNAYNVVRGTNADSTTVIDGFTVEKGCANIPDGANPLFYRSRGGGIFLSPVLPASEVAPVIQNCIFRNNYSAQNGQAIFSENAYSSLCNTKIAHCRFMNNSGYGGSVGYQIYNGIVNISDCWFGNNGIINLFIVFYDANLPGQGSLILRDTFSSPMGTKPIILEKYVLKSGSSTIEKCVFTNNQYAQVSAIIAYPLSTLKLTHCEFTNNRVIFCDGPSTIEMTGNLIQGNDACNFWFTDVYFATPTEIRNISKNIFLDNKFIDIRTIGNSQIMNNIFSGGNLNFQLSAKQEHIKDAVVSNCIFYDQKLRVKNVNFSPVLYKGNLHFQNCSFIKCRPQLDTLPIFSADNRDSLVFNSCLFSETGGVKPLIGNKAFSTQEIIVTNSVFDLSDCNQIGPDGGVETCAGNNLIGQNIQFTDTAALDFHLLPCAPGVNFGDLNAVLAQNLNTDYSGQARVSNGLPDAGALETGFDWPDANVIPASCHGKSDGSIHYQTADCNNWQVQWETNNGTTGTGMDSLAAGIYYLTVSNGLHITMPDTLTISEPDIAWTLDYATTPASSNGAMDGSVFTEINGASGSYTYLWSNGVTTADLQQISPGQYALTVTDNNGCTAGYTFVLGVVGTAETYFQQVSVFPNPVYPQGAITLGMPDQTTTVWIDQHGRSMGQGKVESGKCKVPQELRSGTYRLLCRTPEGKQGYALVFVMDK